MNDGSLADRFDAFVLDLDGVVYVGERAVPRAPEAVRGLRARGKRVLFLTNDPRSSRAHYARRLQSIGVPAADDDVLTSGAATAQFLVQRAGLAGARVYVVGSPAFKAEMETVGLTLVDGRAERPDAVVVGGHEGFAYDELETAAGRRAQVVGKPEPYVFEIARARLDPAERVAIVGDNLDSDVAGGRRAGLATILVLTGIATADDAARAAPPPDYVVADLGALLESR